MNALEKLQSLNMAENPYFTKNCVQNKRNIIKKLPNLLIFNGDSRQQILEVDCNHSHDDNIKDQVEKLKTTKEKKDKDEKRKIRPPPTLENLLANLDAANSHPSFASDHVKVLWANSNELIEKIDMIDEYFVPE